MRRRKLLVRCLLVLFALTAGWVILAEWVFPPRLFRKAVLNPIPASVHGIRGSGYFAAERFHTYVLRFSINEVDLPLILASDQFRKIGYVDCYYGILSFGETPERTRGFALFPGWRAWVPHRWCQVAKWSALRAYCAEREGPDFHKVLLLLHDADNGQAFFINYEMRGNWEWSPF